MFMGTPLSTCSYVIGRPEWWTAGWITPAWRTLGWSTPALSIVEWRTSGWGRRRAASARPSHGNADVEKEERARAPHSPRVAWGGGGGVGWPRWRGVVAVARVADSVVEGGGRWCVEDSV
jgi:hypothetical protein